MNETINKSVTYSKVEIGGEKLPQIQGVETWAIDKDGCENKILSVELLLMDSTNFFNEKIGAYIEFKRAGMRILAKITEIKIKKYSIKFTLNEVEYS